MPGKLIDRDRGMRAMVKLARKLGQRNAQVVVGVTGERATASHDGAGFPSVVDIAVIHEFGTDDGHIPARSFIRSTVDDGKIAYQRLAARAFVALLMQTIKLRQPQDPLQSSELQRLGLRVEGAIKKRIAAGIEPALAPSTQRAKGDRKLTPLINTGQLRASITSLVRLEGEEP